MEDATNSNLDENNLIEKMTLKSPRKKEVKMKITHNSKH